MKAVPYHFSPAERQRVLDHILATLQDDERVVGIVLVGSGAEGFDDLYSDIDLCVVIGSEQDVRPAFEEWGGRIRETLPVFYYLDSVRAPNVYLWVLLLDSFLELDVCFLCLADLYARRGRWKVVLDHTGQIEGIMQASWENRAGPDREKVYRDLVDSIWHYVIRATVAVQRELPWRVVFEIEQIRDRAIELRGLREGLETKRFRSVDRMSEDFRRDIERTLVSSFDKADLMEALQAATQCFFQEARHLDETLGLDLAQRFEAKMQQYLAIFRGGTDMLSTHSSSHDLPR